MKKRNIILSAVVLAKNEEARIAVCLEKLKFADEVLVVDNGSTDKTQDIAKKYGASIVSFQESDFSKQRNIGKEKAKGRWILYVDADEEVTEKLKKEIIRTISKKQKANGYYIPRRNYYLGYEWPVQDKMQRLFLKDALIRWEGKLHETAVVKGQMGILEEPLIHNTHRSLEEMVQKTNEWSKMEAELRFHVHHPKVVWWRFIRVMITGFYRSFVKEGGWRMGTVGWIESIYQGFSMFITYAKLWEMQNKVHSS